MPDGRRLTEYPPEQYVKLLKETSLDRPQTGRADLIPDQEMLGLSDQQGTAREKNIRQLQLHARYFKDPRKQLAVVTRCSTRSRQRRPAGCPERTGSG